MPSKATHYGECQVCGHVQKLPADRLSLHGYTKRWGFFNGTCTGSRELPFEVSCELVRQSIEANTKFAAELRERAEKLRSKEVGPDETKGWILVTDYIRRTPISTWELVELVENVTKYDDREYRSYHYIRDTSFRKDYRHDVFSITDHVKSRADAIGRLNRKRAAAWESEAKQVDGYIAWQTERLAKWQPRPLRPVE